MHTLLVLIFRDLHILAGSDSGHLSVCGVKYMMLTQLRALLDHSAFDLPMPVKREGIE